MHHSPAAPAGSAALSPDRPAAAVGLALRSLIATVLLPGFITGYAPWRWFGLATVDLTSPGPAEVAALPVVALGAVILFVCIWEFARFGRGTLAPVDPPKHLVVQGPYRYVRNPMYVGVFTILAGELGVLRTAAFFAYVLSVVVAVNVWIVAYEEPTLRRMFGDEYRDYCRRVGRWIPRLSPPPRA